MLLVLKLWKIEKAGSAGGIRAGGFPPLNRHFAWEQEGRRTSCCNLGLTSLTRPGRLRAMNPPTRGPRGAGLGRESRDASTSMRADSIAHPKCRVRDSWQSGQMPGLLFEEGTTDSSNGIRRLEFRAGDARWKIPCKRILRHCSRDALRCARYLTPLFMGPSPNCVRAAKRLRRAEIARHISTRANTARKHAKGSTWTELIARKPPRMQALQTNALARPDESRRMRTRPPEFPDESTRNAFLSQEIFRWRANRCRCPQAAFR